MRSSMKAADNNPEYDPIERTREVWQPRFGRDLSRDEAKQIAANVTGFFSVLAEWLRAERLAPANDNPRGAPSEHEGGRHDG